MSSQQKFYETCKGLEVIRLRAKHLDDLLQNEIPLELQTAAAFGDRSENAEYDEAKRKQNECMEEFAELKHYLTNAVLVDRQKCYEKVMFGSYVKLLENEVEKIYRIVGKYESDASRGLLFYGSPLASALMNRKVGHCFSFKTPSGKENEYEILEIGYYEEM